MKKIIGITAFLLVTGSVVWGHNPFEGKNSDGGGKKSELRKERRKERNELWAHIASPAVELQFNYDFPNAKDAYWTNGNFREVTFSDNGITKTAYYDEDNALVGTTTDVTFSTLPLKAQENIQKNFPGYSVEKVVFFEDNEANETDMYLYNQSFKDVDTFFPVLTKGGHTIILSVTPDGEVSFFQNYQ
jgi:hypothetical protein